MSVTDGGDGPGPQRPRSRLTLILNLISFSLSYTHFPTYFGDVGSFDWYWRQSCSHFPIHLWDVGRVFRLVLAPELQPTKLLSLLL